MVTPPNSEATRYEKGRALALEAYEARKVYLAKLAQAGVLIGRDLDESETDTEPILTPEQQGKANKIIEALVKKFDLDPSDVGVVFVKGENGEKQPVVAHIGLRGIRKGSWDSISEGEAGDYSVYIDGKNIDTRPGMTFATYEAIVADAKANGRILPDSQEASEEIGEVWTETILTGEPVDDVNASIAGVAPSGSVYRDVSRRDVSWAVRCFRPVVPIA